MLKYFLICSLLVLVFTFSCKSDPPKVGPQLDEKKIKEALVQINKSNIDVEDQQIDDYLIRRNWVFDRSKSGIRYYVYQQGVGQQLYSGVTVVLEYELSLIRGDILYSSKNMGDKVFVIDKSDEPSGLHEALKLLKVGDRAKIVVPSYLGYGLMVDENKITAK